MKSEKYIVEQGINKQIAIIKDPKSDANVPVEVDLTFTDWSDGTRDVSVDGGGLHQIWTV